MDDVWGDYFYGTVAYLYKFYFAVVRDDKETGSGRNNTWRIMYDNTRANIEFESKEVTLTIIKYFTLNLAKCKCESGNVVFIKFKSKIKRSLKKEYTISIVFTSTGWVEV